MVTVIDDKSEHCVPFILERLQAHRIKHESRGNVVPPFFLGLNGVQGAGKTTLVSALCNTLRSPPYNLPTIVLSIDDLYLSHSAQVALAQRHPYNPLVQHRGQPSTHDLALGVSVFNAIKQRQPFHLPVYDKSAFNGQGDRADGSTWIAVNQPGEKPIEVVVFEGWCVGFRPLSEEQLERKWREAKAREEAGEGRGRLGRHNLADLQFVNESLKGYDALTNTFGAQSTETQRWKLTLESDAENTQYVYDWRLQQEAAMRAAKGVDYPAYELYTETLRSGVFDEQKGKQLRLVVGKDRKVKELYKI
ncbi:hypothetical protein LTR04_002536 [Oleoguttula sp. CCFEE 6159]|nr:hypothetical protein LTR04_002536 [Oleoguttula sp. CCFEE 6159]